MDERIKYFLKKTRRYQLLFVVLAVVCLLIFLVFNFSLNERAGAFEAYTKVDQQIEIPVTRDGLTDLTIEATGVKLEVGMVSSLSKPQVNLVGDGYNGQLAKVDLEGTSCNIELQGTKKRNVRDLTMQVLLPQGDYSSITIQGSTLDLHVEDLRTGALMVTTGGSAYGYFADVKADTMYVIAPNTPLRFYNNQVSSLTAATGGVSSVSSTTGSITFIENDFDRVKAGTTDSGIFCYDTRVKGQWELSSESGDITMLSRNLPYNVMITAQTVFDGNIDIGYDSRYWKDADVAVDNERLYIGSVGNNPDKIIECTTQAGDISIGKRERYSDLDPYAGDYPFADENPYLIERSTITK